MTTKILAIEDDRDIGSVIKQHLEFEGFSVDVAVSGQQGLDRVAQGRYQLILLDLALPDVNGFAVCTELRKRGIKTPIIMVTGLTDPVDTVRGLDLGADDYVAKPFKMQELTARIRAVLRRAATNPPDVVYQLGDLTLDTNRRVASKGEDELALTKTEFDLLHLLAARGGKVVSRQELLEQIWGGVNITDRTVDVHIASLRKKIEESPSVPQYLLTVRGVGYRINDALLEPERAS